MLENVIIIVAHTLSGSPRTKTHTNMLSRIDRSVVNIIIINILLPRIKCGVTIDTSVGTPW